MQDRTIKTLPVPDAMELEQDVVGFGESVEDLIYSISPVDSPFIAKFKSGLCTFRRCKGGSMRKRRRRKAKPIRFTSAVNRSIGTEHEW